MEEMQSKRGRKPIVFSDEQIAQVEALAAFFTVEQIADYFGIGRTTFFELMNRQPEISERYKKGRSKAIGRVAKTLVEQAAEGNMTAAIFYLKTQGGWRETQSVDLSNSDGSLNPTVIELVAVNGKNTD